MINNFLNFYLYDYEVDVYPNYTDLLPDMIKEKMTHFWEIVRFQYKTDVMGMLACFYDRTGIGNQCISFGLKHIKSSEGEITSFHDNDLVKGYSDVQARILVMPYFLFENDEVTEYIEKAKKSRIDSFDSYKGLDLNTKFIWREQFWTQNIIKTEDIISQKSEVEIQKFGHTRIYQKLFCLLMLNDNAKISEEAESTLTNSFALTIKEWGLDILRQDIVKHGTRAAVAAIMGRNMSHNIGSHVLSYSTRSLKHYEKVCINDMEEINKQLEGADRIDAQELGRSYKNSLNRQDDLLKKLQDVCGKDRYFLDYLRSRMDFIAEISTTDPAWVSRMMFCQDILLPFISQKTLLNYLVMSENMHFDACSEMNCTADSSHHSISFNIHKSTDAPDSGNLMLAVKNINGTIKYKSDAENRWKPLFGENIVKLKDDIHIAIPHGITGVHAFYSILENFIRNSAKHGKNSLEEGKPFELTINLNDVDKDLIKISISDNLGNCNEVIIKSLNDGLSDKLVNDKGIIVPGNWGLKEMKISSCFLRMGGPTDIDKHHNFPPNWSATSREKNYLKPTCCSCSEGKSCKTPHVKYDFYLLKPKDVLLIDVGTANEKKGVLKISHDELTDEFIKNGVPHRFLVCGDVSRKIIVDNKEFLPIRQLNYFEIEDYTNSTNPFYKAWMSKAYGKAEIIYFYKAARRELSLTNNHVTYTELSDATSIAEDLIVFDEHGERRNKKPRKGTRGYYQSVSGAHPIKRLLLNMVHLDAERREEACYELAEAALTKVLIADERVWEGNSNRIEDLKWMNIELVNLKDKIAYLTEIESCLETFKPHFFIIHQGLLDKMSEKDRNTCDKIAVEHCSYVITSGRGLPNSLRPGARFLEISALERFVNENDKYGLVQVLYSLRRYRNCDK